MDNQSLPELEDLVKHELERSVYRLPEQDIETAVSLLHAHETWLTEYRAEIA
jgi:hypothetical protein